MKIDADVFDAAKVIWNYHLLNHSLEKSDCIIVLGSHDLRVAVRGAKLFLEGLAPLLLFSGGLGNLTKDLWDEPEADKFANIALELGVPADKILVENKSTNTGENIRFSYNLLKEKNISPAKLILVQKPYMERRTFATFLKQWPVQKINIAVTSPRINFDEYPNDNIKLDEVINIMVGDLQRIKEYPSKGFQIYQEIPADVWKAYKKLVRLGFNKHLIK